MEPDAFQTWWDSLSPAEHKLIGVNTAKYVWTCAWHARQEKDAKIADSWDNGSSGNAARVIARCIRAQGD